MEDKHLYTVSIIPFEGYPAPFTYQVEAFSIDEAKSIAQNDFPNSKFLMAQGTWEVKDDEPD